MRKRIFVTGGTGFIGSRLVQYLVNEGHEVVALARSKAKSSTLQRMQARTVIGDLSDVDVLEKGMAGATEVYHLAALAGVWAKGNAFRRVNVEGTVHLLEAAKRSGVEKLVVTSTAGVIGPAIDGPVHEYTPRQIDFFTDYERTKHEAELITKEYAEAGLHAVIVNPTRVYGPGPLTVSNAVTQLIKQYAEGSWRFMPGDGQSMGNYVFVEDVVKGHTLAMEHGHAGERYLLGGEDISYQGFFDTVAELNGQKYKLYNIPLAGMLAFGKLQLFLAEYFGRQPVITPGWVSKFSYHWQVSSAKAQKELGYKITPLAVGIEKTLDWLQKQGKPHTR